MPEGSNNGIAVGAFEVKTVGLIERRKEELGVGPIELLSGELLSETDGLNVGSLERPIEGENNVCEEALGLKAALDGLTNNSKVCDSILVDFVLLVFDLAVFDLTVFAFDCLL